MIKMCMICIVAGLASGIGVGFVGMSAATVISPMLIAFLGCPWYEAVGIGLMADVPAAAIAARTYQKHGYVDLKNGRFMLGAVLIMVIIGSYLSQYMPDTEMGLFSVAMALFMGAKFVLKPDSGENRRSGLREGQRGKVLSILAGAYIGLYCGFVGLGGGLLHCQQNLCRTGTPDHRSDSFDPRSRNGVYRVGKYRQHMQADCSNIWKLTVTGRIVICPCHRDKTYCTMG